MVYDTHQPCHDPQNDRISRRSNHHPDRLPLAQPDVGDVDLQSIFVPNTHMLRPAMADAKTSGTQLRCSGVALTAGCSDRVDAVQIEWTLFRSSRRCSDRVDAVQIECNIMSAAICNICWTFPSSIRSLFVLSLLCKSYLKCNYVHLARHPEFAYWMFDYFFCCSRLQKT